MEKIKFSDYKNSEEYKKGLEEFRSGSVPEQPKVKIAWYKKSVSGMDWNKKYKHSGYTILNIVKNGKAIQEIMFGFMAAKPGPEDCIEITEYDDLIKIQKHMEGIHHFPQPLEKV